jgi:multidrug efflux pump
VKLSQFCIKRPVFSIVISCILVVLGLLSMQRLVVRGYPVIAKPVLSVITTYSGASSEVVENNITTPVENQLSGISGLRSMHSTSSQGRSRVTLEFNSNVNIDSAADNVRSILSGFFIKHLPTGVDVPVVQKHDPDREQSALLSLRDSKMNEMQLTDYANRYIVPKISRNTGVSAVNLFGFRDYAMRIVLDPMKMAAQGVTVADLTSALESKNVNVASGEIKSSSQYIPVFSAGKLQTAKQFNDLVIRDQDGFMLRFSDVAHAQMGPESTDSAMYVDGKKSLGIAVFTESTANPIKVAEEIRSQLSGLQASLPKTMHLKFVYDASVPLKAAIHNVYHDLLIAILLVVLVVWLFLGSWRAVFIPVILIPICIISVFSCLLIANMSINVFTLLAIVLAIGLVVDDAIVVLENVSRHIENGESPLQAAKRGSNEIGPAIIAMTITLAAVYLPLGFTDHMSGIILRSFAYTLAMAVIISGFVALTLSPMMCSKLLLPHKSNSAYLAVVDSFFIKLRGAYKWFLRKALSNRTIILIPLLLALASGGYFYSRLPTVLVPSEDMGVLALNIDSPANSSFEYVTNYANQLQKKLSSIKAIKNYLLFSDASGAGGWIILQPYSKRKISSSELSQKITRLAKQIPGPRLAVFSPGGIGGGGKGGSAIKATILSSANYESTYKTVDTLLQQIRKWPEVQSAEQDLQLGAKQYKVKINQDLAANLGVSPGDISSTLTTMLAGSKVTSFNWHAMAYDVLLQVPQNQLKDLSVINRMYVRSASGNMIALSSLVTVTQEESPVSLQHLDRQRADEITIHAAPGVAMGAVVNRLQSFLQNNLPESDQVVFRGMARDMLESQGTLAFTFGLALVFIYLVLAAQFESFIDPLVILFSVPLSIVGGLFALWAAGGSVGIYSGIGFVTLIGLVAKHGILITNFTNQLRQQGMPLVEALIESASLRLRPILMTTIAMAVGAIPLVLASGANAHGLQHIGLVVLGGLLIGSFFSLLVVPIAYSFFGKWRRL